MTLETNSLDAPGEKGGFEHSDHRVGDVAPATIAMFGPGWKWSNDVKPIAGIASCEVPDTGSVIAGRRHVKIDDGVEGAAGPGDACVIFSGHNGRVVGDEPCVLLDWSGSANYARSAG
jgi:hypothetical protein